MKEVFEKELALITNEEIRQETADLLQSVPEYFYHVAASSTGKYHPAFTLGEGGLVRHTRAAVMIAEQLMQLEMFSKIAPEHDYVIAALLLHDTFKHGAVDEGYTITLHPSVAAEYIRTNAKNEQYREIVPALVETHMGQWTKDYKTGKEMLKKPVTPTQKLVHLADYLASRKFIDIKFD